MRVLGWPLHCAINIVRTEKHQPMNHHHKVYRNYITLTELINLPLWTFSVTLLDPYGLGICQSVHSTNEMFSTNKVVKYTDGCKCRFKG